MTQQDRDLLLKDLCARLPYGVKVKVTPVPELKHLSYDAKLFNINTNNIIGIIIDDNSKYIPHNIEEIKPYLFPLSSMTEEQKKDLAKFVANGVYDENIVYDWYNKNHFDYRGLIPMGLAKDATGLNIY